MLNALGYAVGTALIVVLIEKMTTSLDNWMLVLVGVVIAGILAYFSRIYLNRRSATPSSALFYSLLIFILYAVFQTIASSVATVNLTVKFFDLYSIIMVIVVLVAGNRK